MLNLSILVKSAVVEAINGGTEIKHQVTSNVRKAQSDNQQKLKKKKKRRHNNSSKRKQTAESGSPSTTGRLPFNFNTTADLDTTIIPATVSHISSDNQLNSTIIGQPTQASNITASSVSHGVRIADKRTYLWLSGFHHTSTVPQVTSLVSEVLGLQENDIICRSLKSAKKNYSDFNYISFRIGLKSTDVKGAFQPNKWPEGIVCKYFESKQRKN